ncbi:MAG: YbaK/EbsC family protein [Candidatus Nanohaloarchaea archaeon]
MSLKSFTQKPSELEQILDFLEEDIQNVRKVIEKLEGLDADFEVHAKAETVDESVQHSPIDRYQIIKTLIFKASDDFIAVMCPGHKRVDEDKLEDLVGEVRMAKPSEVEEETGYIVGGVSPFNLEIPVYASDDIPEGEVRPAGGSRVIGVKIDREELFNVVEPEVVDVV